jgi:virulence factor Mce-like protein
MRGMLHFVRELVLPSRRARAVPLGRLAIGSMFVFVVLFVIFTLSSMGVQLPFVSHPYTLRAYFNNADGLDASNGPQVSVAGVPEGQVTNVSYVGGRALVTMSMTSDARGKVFADATVRVRPFNGANFLQVDILPGTPSKGALSNGSTLDSSRSSIPVATDQVFSVLDADTRAYLQVLTEQAGIALHGRGGELANALQRLDPLSNEARQIGAMLAERSNLISQLVGNTDTIFQTLGVRHQELAHVLSAGTRLLSVTGSRTAEIAQATRQFPAVLAQGNATSRAIVTVGPEVERALREFAPAAAAFTSGLRSTRRAVPALDQFLAATRSLVQDTSDPSRELLQLAANIGSGVAPAIAGYEDLTQIMKAVVAHEKPIAKFSDAISGILSTQDTYGVLGRVKIIGIQAPSPEDLGLSPAAASGAVRGSTHTQLEVLLTEALRRMCKTNDPVACVLAVATPGLPGSLVPRSRGLMGVLHRTPGAAP